MKEKNYNNSSDEQLANLIKSGDYEPFGELLGRYMPYIVKSAFKYSSALEAEDLVSEGILAFYLAVKSYSPDKSSFKIFVNMCIERGILAQYRYSKALKRIPSSLISSIDDIDVADSKNPENLVIEKESFMDLFDAVKGQLSEFEYRVFREFISGKSYKEIADDVGKGQKAIDNALRRVRAKISDLKPN